MQSNDEFDLICHQFRIGDLNTEEWNFCYSHDTYYDEEKPWAAYIMGTGAEQCLGCKFGFSSIREICDLYYSLGVDPRRVFAI